ncbi:MAG: tyrosine-type recombinase/integrase [Planctomycetaceae bacterium]
MPKSTTSKSRGKGAAKRKDGKPYEGFPLFPHNTGRWCKNIRGKFHYFGKVVDNPEGKAALEEFNRQWPYISEGRVPPPNNVEGKATVADLCNGFRNAKRRLLESGELSPSTYTDYVNVCDMLVAELRDDRPLDDLRPDDFGKMRASMAKRWGPTTLKNELNLVRIALKYGRDVGLIDRDLHRDMSLRPPKAKALRKARNERGPLLFTADEIRRILASADVHLKAMVLLGLNGGLGNTDIAEMPQGAIDWEGGWLNYPRPKTEVPRRIPLWPETVEALRRSTAKRPEPKDSEDFGLAFVSREGRRFVRLEPKIGTTDIFVRRDSIGERFRKLLHKLGINGRKGLGFYTLRRNFETVGGESRDQVAVDSVMGHVDGSMAAIYRQGISDDRLRAVVETVRAWLWPAEGERSERDEARE